MQVLAVNNPNLALSQPNASSCTVHTSPPAPTCCGLCHAGLSDSSSKVQVSAVNILNLALSQPTAAAELTPFLQSEESTLLAALSGLLDHSLALLRAKALVTIMLLCRYSSAAI